jgi:uridylate kinase
MESTPETIAISLGGSLLFPGDDIDTEYLKKFKDFITGRTRKGERFLIVTGGGMICRKYQQAAQELGNASEEDTHRIGLSTVATNAHLLRLIFESIAYPQTVDDFTEFGDDVNQFSVVVGGAAVPGRSTDYNAVDIGSKLGAKRVLNLSNVDYVYDSDPRKNPNAQKFELLSWGEYRKLIPAHHSPGMNSPFDPVASQAAQKLGIEVAIMNGANLANLSNYLDGKPFLGTTIR